MKDTGGLSNHAGIQLTVRADEFELDTIEQHRLDQAFEAQVSEFLSLDGRTAGKPAGTLFSCQQTLSHFSKGSRETSELNEELCAPLRGYVCTDHINVYMTDQTACVGKGKCVSVTEEKCVPERRGRCVSERDGNQGKGISL